MRVTRVEDVGLVVEHLLGLGRGVAVDRDVDLVDEPVGMPGILKPANDGFLTSVYDAFGTILPNLYGPIPTGGVFDSTFIGVVDGIGAAAGNARRLSNAP